MTDETTARDRAIRDLADRIYRESHVSSRPGQCESLEQIAVELRALAGAPPADVAALRKRIADTLHMGLDDATPNDPLADDDDHERWVARVQEWADWVHEQYAPLLAAPEGVDAADEPTYRHTRERRAGEPVDPAADLARYDALLAETPEDYPGRGRMLAHREQLAREAAPEGVDAADEQDAMTYEEARAKARELGTVFLRLASTCDEQGRELTAAQAANQRVEAVLDDWEGIEGTSRLIRELRGALDGDTTEEA